LWNSSRRTFLREPRKPESLAALGFLTVGRCFQNSINDIIDDRIDVVSRGLLALTVSCARCHDHKYDPIPTSDYYSLHGVFLRHGGAQGTAQHQHSQGNA
jgi:hypothetical protein